MNFITSIFTLKFWCSLTVLTLSTSCCMADDNPVDIVTRALICFNDHYVYSGCQSSYRLSAQGNINVPPQATEEYCAGPCLSETKLVLDCVNNIMYNFKFYNGASVRNVQYTLDLGCGHTNKRGDFNVLQNLEENSDPYGDFYDDGNRVTVSISLLMLVSFIIFFWGY